MADVTKVQASDGTIYTINDEDDYTKDEIDAMLADKADVGVSYTKAEDDALLAEKASNTDLLDGLALKADKVDTYTKTEVDDLLDAKAGVGDSYTKAEDDALLAAKADKTDVDDALLLKADKADTYTKSEADGLLADKADVGDSYTKAEDDALLADKADSTAVYTKAEVDALIGGIKMMPLLDWATPIWTPLSATDSFTASGKCYLYGWVEGSGAVRVLVNGGEASIKASVSTRDCAAVSYPIELVAGDVVTLGDVTVNFGKIHVYAERSV